MKELTTCYIAIGSDRHTDTTAHVFSDKMAAIEWARKQAREMDSFGELTEKLNSAMIQDGWVYYGCYSCEVDSIYVVERKIDEEVYR